MALCIKSPALGLLHEECAAHGRHSSVPIASAVAKRVVAILADPIDVFTELIRHELCLHVGDAFRSGVLGREVKQQRGTLMTAATSLLTHQHGHILSLVEKLEESDRDARVALVLELDDELTAHLAIASYFVYGIARDAAGIELDPYRRSQATLRSALKQMLHAEVDDDAWAASVGFLKEVLAAHVRAEEGELFPATERAVQPSALDAIGTRMEAFYTSMRRDPLT
jgi:hypothetical protein